MVNRLIATGLLALSLLWLVACGTSGVGITGAPTKDEAAHGGSGVKAGGFEVIRYNQDGIADSSLNSTLTLNVQNQGGQTALVINVNDSSFTSTVALDVRYDSGSVHPADVKFGNLLGSPDEVLSASFLTDKPGVAAIGQTGIHDYKPASLSGQFATLTFAPGALRAASAAGGVHENAQGVGYIVGDKPGNPIGGDPGGLPNLEATNDLANGTAKLTWYTAWQRADGDQNGEVNISDLATLGKFLNVFDSADWRALPGDYDDNGQVNVSDLAAMGKYLGEGTDDYIVEAGDNDGSTTGLTTVTTQNWLTAPSDKQPPTDANNASATTLGAVFGSWSVDFTSSSPFTFAQLAALDANTDGTVTLHVTPERGGVKGVSSTIDVGVVIPDTTHYINVTGVDIQVTGATGGTGGSNDVFDAANTQGSVAANSTIDVKVNGISGTYTSQAGAGAFTSGATNFPGDMTQQDYDDALADIRATVTWVVANNPAADADFRHRGDWLTPTNPPASGDLGQGLIFADDDPDSTGAKSEGLLTVNLPSATDFDSAAGRSITASAFTQDFLFDVTPDPAAPVMGDPIDINTGQPVTEFTPLDGTRVSIDLTLAQAPADPTQTTLELEEIAPDGTVANTLNFSYQVLAPQQGQFYFRSTNPPQIAAFVNGILTAGAKYHFSFRDAPNGAPQNAAPWSSLNTPSPTITVAPPPQPQPLISVPSRLEANEQHGDYYTMHIFLSEPKVRRNPNGTMNLVDHTYHKDDDQAFNDQLKKSGAEFVMDDLNFVAYPKVIAVVGTDPSVITPQTTSETVNYVAVTPDEITLDTKAFTQPDFGNPTVNFAYQVFNKDGSSAGEGTFEIDYIRGDDPAPFAVNWGVNVFNRDATATAKVADLPGLYTNQTLNLASTSNGGTPDVMWFQFNGGFIGDPDPRQNTLVVLEDTTNPVQNGSYAADLRIVGIGPNQDYLAIHVLTDNDKFPMGNLVAGDQYNVHLNDPKFPTPWESTYANQLLVVDNP